jgi:hypothetical protein
VTGPGNVGDDDPAGHYVRLREEVRAVQRTIGEWPEIIAARAATKPPKIRLLCPRGHPLLPVTLADDEDRGLGVVPAREDRPHGGRVSATLADPIPLHQPGPLRDVTDGRTAFDCPKCSYSGRVRPARLLALYAAALRRRRSAIELETPSS